jgi:alginate O-acetyltransferase complex protein AlgI
MLFNTIDFVIFFFIVVGLVSILKYRRFQHLYIIFASIFFLYYTNNYLVVLLIFTILFHYYIGREIYKANSKDRKKIFLIIGLAGSLGLLGFFKYADFAILQFNILGQELNLNPDIPLLNLALPIGISFYTFQSISYIIDIYRGSLVPSKTLREYTFFVAFFPTLVSGPILRARQFLPQLREKIEHSSTGGRLRQFVIQHSNLKLGLTLIALGFLKKMFFADNIGLFVDKIFSNPIGMESFSIMLGAIAFGVQVYCDFSGYSDIAIGAAAIFGLKIPLNFNKPFFATSFSDFWSRWHISLSKWVRDYLYFPLVFKNRKSSVVIYSSLLFSMLLLGLWHGASWNFIIFGGIHGIFIATHTVIKRKYPQISQHKFFKKNTGKIFSIIITQYLVFLAFLSFRITDIDHMWYSMQKYVLLDFATKQFVELVSSNQFPVILIIVFFILNFISYKHGKLQNAIANIKLRYWFSFLASVLMLVLIFQVGSAQDFIYFKF